MRWRTKWRLGELHTTLLIQHELACTAQRSENGHDWCGAVDSASVPTYLLY